MTPISITHHRLHNQQLARTRFKTPGEVVAWLGAVQAQDYLGALWAVGLRTEGATEKTVEQALADRTIVRTWPMRGTLHFVAPADIRWILELLTPRVVAHQAPRLQRQFGIDAAVLTQSKRALVKALRGGKHLSREALHQVLEQAHIATADQRGLHILGQLAQAGLICFGARQGKQQTFVLLDEWVPAAKPLKRDEALAELTRRYFTSHGPASVHDFAWWSGLTLADVQAGLAMTKSHLVPMVIDDQTYWHAASLPAAQDAASIAYLLPAYDEYTVAYKDRNAVLDPVYAKRADSGYGIFSPTLVVDGQVVGTWKRALKKDSVSVTPNLFRVLKKSERQALAVAARRYGAFLDLPVVLAE